MRGYYTFYVFTLYIKINDKHTINNITEILHVHINYHEINLTDFSKIDRHDNRVILLNIHRDVIESPLIKSLLAQNGSEYYLYFKRKYIENLHLNLI